MAVEDAADKLGAGKVPAYEMARVEIACLKNLDVQEVGAGWEGVCNAEVGGWWVWMCTRWMQDDKSATLRKWWIQMRWMLHVRAVFGFGWWERMCGWPA
eukprot:1162018-Pelagomonas_calceolata.AAC.10